MEVKRGNKKMKGRRKRTNMGTYRILVIYKRSKIISSYSFYCTDLTALPLSPLVFSTCKVDKSVERGKERMEEGGKWEEKRGRNGRRA